MNDSVKSDLIEYRKLQGFDVLEELPPRETIKSYNDEYESSLSNLHFLSCTIPPEHKLIYKFEHNPNASISTSTNQLIKGFEDISTMRNELKPILLSVKESFDKVKESIRQLTNSIPSVYRPQIENMFNELKKFFVKQMSQNFILIKEIAILQKETDEMKQKVQEATSALNEIERHFGVKPRKMTINTNDKMVNMFNATENSIKAIVNKCKL